MKFLYLQSHRRQPLGCGGSDPGIGHDSSGRAASTTGSTSITNNDDNDESTGGNGMSDKKKPLNIFEDPVGATGAIVTGIIAKTVGELASRAHGNWLVLPAM